MKHLLTILIALLTCATLHAQTVLVKGTGAGAVHRSATGAGGVRGVVIPVGPRFTIQANTNLVVDNDSGIIWARDANIGGGMNWTSAVAYCSNLTYATYTDWRLPNWTELSRWTAVNGSTNGLLDGYPSANNPALPLGHPFINIQSGYYWTSTFKVENFRWEVNAPNGNLFGANETAERYVWPCRGP